MPYKNESNVPGGDAPADITTQLCFDPPEGPFLPGNTNIVTGMITDSSDEDWIAIKLTAGVLYTFNLSGERPDGDDTDALSDGPMDTILALYDAKGGRIKGNDDVNGPLGQINSSFQFVPPEDGTYFLSASVFTANLGADNGGTYTVTVLQEEAGVAAPVDGTDKDDKLRGTDAGEKISGLGGNDSLFGLGGDDVLNGGAGNDLLVGGPGGDELNGGADKDTISYNLSPAGVTINLLDGTARGGDAERDTIGADIENVVGSRNDDVLTGNREENTLQGLAGMDVLNGGEGDDMLHGGEGDDVLDGGDENDTLEGGPGADTLTGGGGNDTVSYASSAMGVVVRLHSGKVDGGDAKGDVFDDTATHTYLVKPDPEENDTEPVTVTLPDFIHLTGSGMADVLAGDSRNNTIKGGGGDDMIFGGPGGSHDNSDNEDTLEGEGGNDKIYGGRGNDTLDGGSGNDLLVGGSGADTYIGGPGSDMIYADRADLARSIHGHNVPTAADGADPSGNMGRMPADSDTLSFAKFMDQDLEDGTGITLTLQGNTAVTNIDRLIGTAEDDVLTGRSDSAGDGTGTPAPEIIEGGDGGDMLNGGAGPGDTVSYANSDRSVRVNLADGESADLAAAPEATDPTASGGHAGGDRITGFENIMGSNYDDDLTALTGTAGETGSTLWGLGGDDELEGGVGNDTLEGGADADELDGGFTASTATGRERQNAQVNTLSYAMSDDGVQVDLAVASASGGHADGDEIEIYDYTDDNGTATDTSDDEDHEVATFVNVTGSGYNDRLTGDMFANQLVGGGGNDTLRGGAGADNLVGGPGADMLDGGEDSGERNNMVPDPADSTTTIDASEDWAVYRGASSGVTVDLDLNSGTAGEAMGDTLRNIELVWGSTHGDTFIAGAGADVIHGDGGSDTVSYEASRHGVTVVLPTADDATQFIAAGPDGDLATLADNGFQAAADTVVAAWRGGTAQRPAAAQTDDGSTTTKSYAEGDILESIENVTGSRDKDVIIGDAVPNVLMGGGGNDELAGGEGNDTLHGGEGNDTLGQTTAIAAVADVSPPIPAGTDAGDDTMHGGPGNDKLYGGAGADTLNGGAGDDDLTGGADADVFVFTRDGVGSDVILDFSQTGGIALTDGTATAPGTGDKIDLRAFDIDDGDLAGLLSERAGSVIVNLEAYGGGKVTIQGVTVQGLMDSRTDPTSGDPEPHLIHNDMNGALAGVGDDGTDGVFIL